MSAKGSVQDAYLKDVSDRGDVIRISLTSGKEVRGAVKAFDAFTLVVSTKGMDILVYKSAIAAIGPASAPE